MSDSEADLTGDLAPARSSVTCHSCSDEDVGEEHSPARLGDSNGIGDCKRRLGLRRDECERHTEAAREEGRAEAAREEEA